MQSSTPEILGEQRSGINEIMDKMLPQRTFVVKKRRVHKTSEHAPIRIAAAEVETATLALDRHLIGSKNSTNLNTASRTQPMLNRTMGNIHKERMTNTSNRGNRPQRFSSNFDVMKKNVVKEPDARTTNWPCADGSAGVYLANSNSTLPYSNEGIAMERRWMTTSGASGLFSNTSSTQHRVLVEQRQKMPLTQAVNDNSHAWVEQQHQEYLKNHIVHQTPLRLRVAPQQNYFCHNRNNFSSPRSTGHDFSPYQQLLQGAPNIRIIPFPTMLQQISMLSQPLGTSMCTDLLLANAYNPSFISSQKINPVHSASNLAHHVNRSNIDDAACQIISLGGVQRLPDSREINTPQVNFVVQGTNNESNDKVVAIEEEVQSDDVARSKDKPRRPLNAYNFFFSEEREIIMEEVKFALDKKRLGIKGECTLSNRSKDLDSDGARSPHHEEIKEILESPPILPQDRLNDLRAKVDLKTRQVLNARKEGDRSKKAPHRKTHGIGFRPLSKAIAKRWKELGLDRKKHYQKLAKMDLDRYTSDMDEFAEKMLRSKKKITV